jgi:hypothetical protein
MNPHGISVFYGATDPLVALSEIRPPVGSRVVIGRFELLRPLRLLDLEALRKLQVKGSIFDRSYLERLQKAKFLEWVSRRIMMPVMPDDEAYEYLPTQVVSDFLATNADPLLDGVIYPSVQGAERKPNVVLFHKAARVQPLELPDGIEISASLNHWTDDGLETDYWVWEEVPSPPAENHEGLTVRTVSLRERDVEDQRGFSLRIDLSSLRVHHIVGINFATEAFRVSRHRMPRRDPKF